jgi:hypothetical protein
MLNIHIKGKQHNQAYKSIGFTLCSPANCLLQGISMGEGRDVYRVLVGKRKGKRPLGRPRRR